MANNTPQTQPASSAPAAAANIAKNIAQGNNAPNGGNNPPTDISQLPLMAMQAAAQRLNGISVPTPTPTSFAPLAPPQAPAQILQPTAPPPPGQQYLLSAEQAIAPVIQTVANQTQALAKTGRLTGVPNFQMMGAPLASMQNAINQGSFTPNMQSESASRMYGTDVAANNVANELQQRQIQEANAERANAQRTQALVSSNAAGQGLNVMASLVNSPAFLSAIFKGMNTSGAK